MIPRPTVLLLLACLLVAPVAVVCAVGVWRAARPRPEVLTMPAPGALCGARGTDTHPRICSPAVSAENIRYFDSDDLPLSVTYEHQNVVTDTKTINADFSEMQGVKNRQSWFSFKSC